MLFNTRGQFNMVSLGANAPARMLDAVQVGTVHFHFAMNVEVLAIRRISALSEHVVSKPAKVADSHIANPQDVHGVLASGVAGIHGQEGMLARQMVHSKWEIR